jgi:hypothetical protein
MRQEGDVSGGLSDVNVIMTLAKMVNRTISSSTKAMFKGRVAATI